MALRDQPYLPLFVQDFMTDEKLIECSASATGIYIRLMCILHKQENYGQLLLKQKYKQNTKQILNFACQLATSMPYNSAEIEGGLMELLDEKVVKIDGDLLIQSRMVKDNDISTKRAAAGSSGGKKTIKKFAKAKHQAKVEAKPQANSEYEYENVNEIINKINPETEKFVVPEIIEIYSTKFPLFVRDSENDSKAAYKIFTILNTDIKNHDGVTVMGAWGQICDKMDNFYGGTGLKMVASNLPSIIHKIRSTK